MAIQRMEMNARRSRVVVHNGTVYLAGQVADDVSGDITSQTREALGNVDKMLALAGTDKSRILSATIWLRDMADFQGMNAVWDKWIDPANPPARACGKVEMARPEMRIEVLVICAAR